MNEITLHIPNISCNHCLMTIKRESALVKGVEFVGGSVEDKTVTFKVANDQILTALKAALAEAGYPAA